MVEIENLASVMSMGGRPANSRREIKIIDTTLRDAHQSIWATRMRTEHIVSMLDDFDNAGFAQVDLMAPIQFDVSVRYLKENPWERVRLAHKHAPNTKFRTLVRSKNLASFDFLPDDVIISWVEEQFKNGHRVIGAFDGLNDVGNISAGLLRAKELGAHTFGALSFSESPVHTDELYVEKAKELIEKADVDSIMLKDAAGLLTPDRIRTLVPAIKEVIGDHELELHSHCLTALAPQVYLEAVELGVDSLHTSIAPLANGNGQPATQRIVRDLRALGYTVNVDDERIDNISKRLQEIADTEGKPVGNPLAYDAMHFMHQLPGGMLSNFHEQLKTAGLEDRFEELLREVARVREELAFPIMITPFAQFVGTQAVMNVMTDERYKMVPNEVKKYALGYYGTLLADIEPEVLKSVLANGASEIAETPPVPQPMLPDLEAQYPDEPREMHLLRAMFAGSQVDDMKQAVAEGRSGDEGAFPTLNLLKDLYNSNDPGRYNLKLGSTVINLEKGEA